MDGHLGGTSHRARGGEDFPDRRGAVKGEAHPRRRVLLAVDGHSDRGERRCGGRRRDTGHMDRATRLTVDEGRDHLVLAKAAAVVVTAAEVASIDAHSGGTGQRARGGANRAEHGRQ